MSFTHAGDSQTISSIMARKMVANRCCCMLGHIHMALVLERRAVRLVSLRSAKTHV